MKRVSGDFSMGFSLGDISSGLDLAGSTGDVLGLDLDLSSISDITDIGSGVESIFGGSSSGAPGSATGSTIRPSTSAPSQISQALSLNNPWVLAAIGFGSAIVLLGFISAIRR